MNNTQFLRRLTLIICLTNIPAILTLPLFFRASVGWILGSAASIVRLFWLAHSVKSSLADVTYKARISSLRSFYLRYLFLVVYAVLVIKFIKPDIIFLGIGLLSGQIAIFLNEIYESIRQNKYFRG